MQTLTWKTERRKGRSNYHRRYEPIWYGWQKKSSYRGDRKQDDVWEIDRPTKSPEHPTMKPVELVERAILNSSVKGDVVLDLFGGGGSTLIACEKTGRRCRMVELEPGYCQVIIDRWESVTGKKSQRIDK
jgi:DNA modification methylase